MKVEPEQLKAFILDSGLVKPRDLETAEAEAKRKKVSLEKVLVEKGLVSKEDLTRLEAYILGIPYVNLKKKRFLRRF